MNSILDALRTANECLRVIAKAYGKEVKWQRDLINKAIDQTDFAIESITNGYPCSEAEKRALLINTYNKKIDEQEDRANDYD